MDTSPPPAALASIARAFGNLPDPRVERTRAHALLDLLTVALLAMICGAEGWSDIETFAEARLEWLQTVLPLTGGAPSDDTFRRVFAALDPAAFARCFGAWVQQLIGATTGKVVAIDGKTLRGSYDRASGASALHLVHAWVTDNHALLGQFATAAKSNETAAIPELIALLDLRGALVTIDAAGCHKTIAAAVVNAGADYLFCLKDNHPRVHAEVTAYLDEAIESGPARRAIEQVDKGHGRIEVRRAWAADDLSWFADRSLWKGLRSVVRVERERTVGGTTSCERATYLCSLDASHVEVAAAAVRAHWGVENALHWTLDVTFREDQSRVRKDHGPQNLALVRRMALTLLRREPTPRRSAPAKRLRAALNSDYLLRVLGMEPAPNAAK